MIEYLELGPVPVDEEAAQFGVDPDFDQKNFRECRNYMLKLEKLFLPQLPEGMNVQFFIKQFAYDDDGSYREVCIKYDRMSSDFAFYVESNLPMTWEDDHVVGFTGE